MSRQICLCLATVLIVGVMIAPQNTQADEAFELYDTAWEITVYSTPNELDQYTSHLAAAGFDGFWISVAPHSGQFLNQDNYNGDSFGSFGNPRAAYFEYIDLIVDKAAQHNLKVGMVVGWANSYVGDAGAANHGGVAPLNTTNAYSYGQFLGARYANHPGIGMWVMGGDYYLASDETDNFGVWENLIAGLESRGAYEPIAYHGHHYVGGLWNQSFFDIAAPLTGHCSSPGDSAQALSSVKSQVGGRPVLAAEMRYEDYVADFCGGGNQIADEFDIEDDTQAAVDSGMAGMVYGHDDRWDWATDPIGSLGSAGEQRMLAVLNVGSVPSAEDDYVTLDEGDGAQIAVLDNDVGVTTLSLVGQPDHGSATVVGNEISYMHDGSENHNDQIEYLATGPSGSDSATVFFSMDAVNDPPLAFDDAITVVQGGTASLDLAANDLDPDGPSMSVSIVSEPAHGTVSVNGTFVNYAHLGDENTADSFTYELSDGLATDIATVIVQVSRTNTPPTLEGPDTVESIAGLPGVISFEVIDTDEDLVTLEVAQAPTHGTLEVDSTSVIYSPNAEYVGTDTFSVRAYDGAEFSAEHSITVTITARSADVSLFDPEAGRWQMFLADGSVDSFFYGDPGDMPLLGDWDCDGIDTVGMYRPSNGFVYIRNSNTAGFAEQEFFFGIAGDVPLVGDWDGDGCDSLAVYRSSHVYISNVLSTGLAEYDFFFGIPGDRPFSGDFDGDGRTSVGLYRQTTGFVYYRNELATGVADNDFFYGVPSDRIVAGDWDGDGIDSVGIFRPSESRIYLSNQNAQAAADVTYGFGGPADLPIAGRTS